MSSFLRPKDVKGTTVLDRILKAFLSNKLDQLSPADQYVLERITEIDNRYRAGYTVMGVEFDETLGIEKQVEKYTRPYRKMELAKWQMERFKVSMSQAYEDIRMAQQFFLTFESRPDKEFARGQMIYWGEDAAARAQADGDHRAAAAFFKELVKIKQLDRHEDSKFNPEDLNPIRPIIVMDPSQLDQPFPKMENPDAIVAGLLKELKKGVIEKIAEDAEEIEMEDGDGNDV